MSKNFEIELSEDGFKDFAKSLDKIGKKLDSDDFNKFLIEKCKKELDDIMQNENVEEDKRGAEYIAGNHEESNKNYIRLYNDSEIDIESSTTFFSEVAKNSYPSKLSLAEMIEYGTGLIGSLYSKGTGDEWQYAKRSTRDYTKGWEWNNNGEPEHTFGEAGRYIYFQLEERVRAHIDEWVAEYFDRLLGGNV